MNIIASVLIRRSEFHAHIIIRFIEQVRRFKLSPQNRNKSVDSNPDSPAGHGPRQVLQVRPHGWRQHVLTGHHGTLVSHGNPVAFKLRKSARALGPGEGLLKDSVGIHVTQNVLCNHGLHNGMGAAVQLRQKTQTEALG